MEYIVKKEEKLIKFLIHNIQGVSFSHAQKMLRTGKVKVNSKRIKDNMDLKVNDIIQVYNLTKSMPKVDILYEDNNILVVNKPQGLECATRDKSSENTYSLEEIFADKNAIVIHRLDRLTEGIVILARSTDVARDFEKFFRERKVSKFYKAYVYGKPKDEGIKTAYLRKDEKLSKVTISDKPIEGYKEIVTEFKIEKSTDKYSLLDINLHTGRTHQIRGYFSHIGCPILGDKKYSKNTCELEKKYAGYFLTAYKISFNLDGKYTYLNDKTFEISPSWIKYI